MTLAPDEPRSTEHLRSDDLRATTHASAVLSSEIFRNAPSSRRLLEYLITETANGRGDILKGYAIGVDVFGKSEDYDAATDSTVRVQAKRLRDLLAGYYASEGADSCLRIDIPKGAYRVDFLLDEQVFDDSGPAQDSSPPPVANVAQAFPPLQWTALVIIALLCALIGISVYFSKSNDVPLIYVAQFRAGDTSTETALVSTGVQRDLISQLAQYPNINVVGLESAQIPIEQARASQFLGADYVLKGIIFNEGSSLNISTVLVSAADNRVIWSETTRVDIRDTADIFVTQALIASKVGAALGQPQGVIEQVARAQVAGTNGIAFHDYACVLSAHDYLRRKSADGHLRTRACLERVVEEHPDYSDAWALLSWMYGDEARLGFNVRDDVPAAMRALAAAEKAVAANSQNPLAHENLAVAQFYLLQSDKGETSIERAVSLSPNDPDILASAGWNLALAGEYARARALLTRATEHNPAHPAWYFGGLAVSALGAGDNRTALTFARQYSDRVEDIVADYILAAAERANGNDQAADMIIRDVARRFPGGGKPDNIFVKRNRLPTFVVDAAFGKAKRET